VRIGFDITTVYFSRAGILNYVWRLLSALLKVDHDNEYLLLDHVPLRSGLTPGVDLSHLQAPNVQVVQCHSLKERKLTRWRPLASSPCGKRIAVRIDSLLSPLWRKAVDWSLQRELGRALAGVDVFHASDVFQCVPPGAHSVITIHDLSAILFPDSHVPPTREMFNQVAEFARWHADAIIAVSENTRQDVIRHLGVEAERVHVVYEAAGEQFHPIENTDFVAAVTCCYGLEPGRYMLTVGTLEPRKNHIRLVEAFGQLHRARETHGLKLVLAGGKGWLYGDLFRRVEDLGLTEDIVFTGFVPDADLPALMNGALVFVYPSLYEGFGLPVLEAMACGVPVITSNVSSLPEIAGDAAVLVDPRDVGSLAGAMQSLIEGEKARAVLQSKGLSQAARFSWERAARETLHIYQM
jgi:glycosyltransferase involved in cell wall biosynthesis